MAVARCTLVLILPLTAVIRFSLSPSFAFCKMKVWIKWPFMATSALSSGSDFSSDPWYLFIFPFLVYLVVSQVVT